MEKIVGLVPFPILPAHFGGAERCWNVLSRLKPVTIHALNWEAKFEERQMGGVDYVVTPVSAEAHRRAEQLRGQGFLTFDAMPHMARAFLTEYREAVEESDADLIVLEHPWLIDFVGDRPFVYDAHNAETLSFGQRFGTDTPEFLHIKELERRAVQEARAVTYCSEADAEVLRGMFGDFHGIHIPNGVSLPTYDNDKRENLILFIGSVYQPNIEAAQRLVKIAPLLPDFEIVIAGPCSYFVQNLEANVQLVGAVSDRKLDELMRRASLFVNLVSAGSGTHLKVGRALAYGVPVITSQIGARGYSSPIVTDDPVSTIRQVMSQWDVYSEEARLEALALDWDKVVQPMRELVGR